jgi:subtilase family serine protease
MKFIIQNEATKKSTPAAALVVSLPTVPFVRAQTCSTPSHNVGPGGVGTGVICFLRQAFVQALIVASAGILSTAPVEAAERKVLGGHVPAAVARLQPIGRLPAEMRLNLAIGLPLRDQEGLRRLVQQIYDRRSTNFHHYLTPEGFAERFAPTDQDYEAAIHFAETNRLEVIGRYGSRMLFDVSGKVSDVENAFHLTMRTYRHPTEERQFYAPDAEPSLDPSLSILDISGLDDFMPPRPLLHRLSTLENPGTSAGTGPGGTYRGRDFFNAYAPGVAQDGSGQMVGLVEFDGYYRSDITTYETQAGLPNVPLQNVPLPGSAAFPTVNTNSVGEVSLDIEMVISMATNLAGLYVFEGINTADILASMAASNQIKQFSCSWGLSSNATSDNALTLMAAYGQSFFQASGDGDAYIFPIPWPSDHPLVTSVGGTTLITSNNPGVSYAFETVWNSGYLGPNQVWFGNGATGWWGSGGGVSTVYWIPPEQQGVNMGAVGGSTVRRNIPDVAMTASGVWVNYFNGLSGGFIGTSCAAPLWAGFTALVNQKAAALGQAPVGFLNPTLYEIGLGLDYTKAFHDITNGNNAWSGSTSQYLAFPGYDLCTGWGSPNGTNMINTLIVYTGGTWVDFNSPSSFQFGSFLDPFHTLMEATGAVRVAGTIIIKKGASHETMTISKPMTIRGYNGNASIGQR